MREKKKRERKEKEKEKKIRFRVTLISINSIKSSTNIKKFMICNINKETKNYYFIKLPSVHYRGIMKINQLIHKSKSITINIDDDINNFNNMKNDLQKAININEDLILEAAINTEIITEKTKLLKKYNISASALNEPNEREIEIRN